MMREINLKSIGTTLSQVVKLIGTITIKMMDPKNFR